VELLSQHAAKAVQCKFGGNIRRIQQQALLGIQSIDHSDMTAFSLHHMGQCRPNELDDAKKIGSHGIFKIADIRFSDPAADVLKSI